jgi:hypothetical protein
MQYLYTGPSWAKSSFPLENVSITNLAKEWRFDFFDVSQFSCSVLNRVNYIQTLNNKLPIIWIYNEPFGNCEDITGISMAKLLQRSDWKDIWNECNQYCLSAIASLDCPILLIGGHSDIVDCNHANITVACESWQKWLAQQAGMPVKNGVVSVAMDDGGNFVIHNGWGAEIIHRYMHEHPEINPDESLVEGIWDIFYFWKQLEKANLFYDCHPNFRANQLFADFLFPTVEQFLRKTQ